MVFRIADKQRDKKVSVNSFCEILKRLKLMMSEMEVTQLTNLVSRSNNHIIYDEYLECLSAFQINS
jgi:Ca2+-binding EF-hand superfamily protein